MTDRGEARRLLGELSDAVQLIRTQALHLKSIGLVEEANVLNAAGTMIARTALDWVDELYPGCDWH
ncbi:hypothetical protein [Xanthomonas phage XPV3]|uniref:Uncharacterized protein n=1 Tax=Xanthomonas phage XPV1 TaxID=2099860 RepID=A0A3S7HPM8_9CAUD|nr:hypothetical protein KEM12_gp66 [Xanthomonas phage XPV1]AVO24230.1 hypothetical protein [Xanthomonas phage XPV1]AVO24246.1 hypothetical protein [Xanthomonas phage XPV2]AVO24382.1 hypothetical protein [Xanthomonas phage XPV3]